MKKQRQQQMLGNEVLGRDTEEFYLTGAHEQIKYITKHSLSLCAI